MSQHLDFEQLSTDPTFLHDCYMSNVLIILDFFLSLKEVCFWGFPHNLRKSFKMFGPRKCYPRCVKSLLVPNLLNPRNNHILNVLCCTSLERTQNLNASGPAASFFDRGKILCETLMPRCDLHIKLPGRKYCDPSAWICNHLDVIARIGFLFPPVPAVGSGREGTKNCMKVVTGNFVRDHCVYSS